jgi:hypothetical protein
MREQKIQLTEGNKSLIKITWKEILELRSHKAKQKYEYLILLLGEKIGYK